MKLNTDVPGRAGGGAILRNQNGELVAAISFPLIASTSLEAEIQAIFTATRWAIEEGYSEFLVETDAAQVLSCFDQIGGRWNGLIQEMNHLQIRQRVSIGHTLRECNWAAHHLAVHYTTQMQIFRRPKELPLTARQAYFRDLFGLPSFRCFY
ncbi:unnamed protein product [Cuscuta europaea]|uniref:RNase H type-1 domain-containing protein n=1 Tax=Cuscuta europaea TaxID=41803 RepID=A0A9P0YWA8_CUSEU|nr:unnamed protein product [Cuscuta europaea]